MYILILLTSCKKDPIVPNEAELITSLVYTLTPQNGGTPIILSFVDLDGDGGTQPIITTEKMSSNTTYNCSLKLANTSVNPVIDITEDIEAEAKDHQFFFNISGEIANTITVTYNDADSRKNPIGLSSIIKTTNSGTGKMKLTLRHKPNKDAEGVASGIITNAGGETDIEVEFDITVK